MMVDGAHTSESTPDPARPSGGPVTPSRPSSSAGVVREVLGLAAQALPHQASGSVRWDRGGGDVVMRWWEVLEE